ncbi:MAG: hypothetical protein U1F43_09350 [Myxococcota bacterium]
MTRYCDAPGVPVVGDLEPQPKAILAVHPDVVVMARYGSQGDAAAKLGALGLDVRTWPLDSLADMRAATTALGALVGADDRRARCSPTSTRPPPSASRRGNAARLGPVKVLLVYDVQPGVVLTTGGGDTSRNPRHHAGNQRRRARPADLAPRPRGGAGARARRHPARGARPALPRRRRGQGRWSAFPDVPAVKRGAIHVWPDDRLARNGPHLAQVLRRLPALLAP